MDKIQYDQVCSFIEGGKKEATLAAGGEEQHGPGHYISPVIFANPDDDAKVYKQDGVL